MLLSLLFGCVYIPTADTETLSLPFTTSAGKLKVTSLEKLDWEAETSNSSEEEKDCSSPSACTNSGNTSRRKENPPGTCDWERFLFWSCGRLTGALINTIRQLPQQDIELVTSLDELKTRTTHMKRKDSDFSYKLQENFASLSHYLAAAELSSIVPAADLIIPKLQIRGNSHYLASVGICQHQISSFCSPQHWVGLSIYSSTSRYLAILSIFQQKSLLFGECQHFGSRRHQYVPAFDSSRSHYLATVDVHI